MKIKKESSDDMIPMPLIKDLINREVLIFIGAGVSRIAGMPSGIELANLLADELITDLQKGTDTDQIDKVRKMRDNLKEISQMYHSYYKNHKVKLKIQQIIRQREKSVNPKIFKLISDLPLNDIVTTNYDRLIEDNQIKSNYIVIWQDSQLKNYKTLCTNIIKLHGDREDLESIIITKEDYDEARMKRNGILTELTRQFKTKTLLILGYSLEDQDFREALVSSIYESDKTCYCVSLEEDIFKESEWKRKKMEFIHKDALEFLGSILDSIANELREIDKLNIPSKAEEIEDRNPFKFYRTDSVPKWDYQTIAQCFVPPIEFAKICETGTNTIIEGDRGSGKSTILRYLSLESQLGMKRNNKFISIYIKLKPGLVATTKRTEYDREIEKWVEFFSHYLNLIIIERTIETIKFCKMKGWIQIPSENETEFCKHINKFVIDEPNSETVFSLENCLENITYMRNKCQQIEERRTLKHTTSSAYVHTFMEQVVRLAPALDNKFIFICLDEIDNMDDDQKKVLVLFLRDRDAPINYKIGVKTGKMVYRDPYGSMLQFKDDYDIVYPDRFNKERTGEYIKFLEDLANRRLKEYNIDICSLLQLRKKEIRVDGKYYGFTDYCYLSSGIVRLFVTLLKDTIYYAYPQIVEKEIQFQPIPTKIQNEVIIIKSNIHFRNFQECEHPEEVRIFMNTLGALFKEILSKSILIDKPRTVSQIEIENYAQLDPAIRHLISETIDVSLLQIPLRARHQEKTKAPFFGFKFHRMLIPYFRLALPNRWPRTLDAPTMNQLIDIINGRMMQENWVAEITKKFNVDEPDKGTTLDEFDSEELIDRPITTLLDFNNQNVHGEKNE